MRRVICVLAFCLGSLAGCDYQFTSPDRCTGGDSVGELHMVMRPAPGFMGWGVSVAVGDTMPLIAEIRPVTGSSLDIWGSGGCAWDYGDPVPAAIEWSSADTRLATVTSSGVVRGIAEGTATIIARASARGVSGNLDVVVWARAGGG